jgi:hypothetical protein
MKLYTETYESVEKVKSVVNHLFGTEVDRVVTRYVTDEITKQTHQSITLYINQPKDKYSSILFDIEHNKTFDGIRFHTQFPIIPPLYIPSIHFLADIPELFKSLFGYDYVKKVIKMENKMDEDGNIPTIVYFHQTLPRTDSLKDFYLEMYRSRYGYKLEYNRYGDNILIIKRAMPSYDLP